MGMLQQLTIGPAISLPALSHTQRITLQLLKEGSCPLPGPLPLQAHLILDRSAATANFQVYFALGCHQVGHIDISVIQGDDPAANRQGPFALLDWGFLRGDTPGSLVKEEPLAAISVSPDLRQTYGGLGEALLAIGTRIARELGARHLRISHTLPMARPFFARYAQSISQHLEWSEDDCKTLPVIDFYIDLNGGSLPCIAIREDKKRLR